MGLNGLKSEVVTSREVGHTDIVLLGAGACSDGQDNVCTKKSLDSATSADDKLVVQ